jgi:hypothetical protein
MSALRPFPSDIERTLGCWREVSWACRDDESIPDIEGVLVEEFRVALLPGPRFQVGSELFKAWLECAVIE